MTITTNKGRTFEVNYAWGPVSSTGFLMIEIKNDDRNISEIALDFENLDKITRKDKNEGDIEFSGFTQLVGIIRKSDNSIQIVLERK